MYNSVKVDSIPGLNVDKYKIPVDERIVSVCEAYGFEKDKISESVSENFYDNNTSIYYIILNKFIRERYDSISDMFSQDYLDYLNNPKNLIDDNSRKNQSDDDEIIRDDEEKEQKDRNNKKHNKKKNIKEVIYEDKNNEDDNNNDKSNDEGKENFDDLYEDKSNDENEGETKVMMKMKVKIITMIMKTFMKTRAIMKMMIIKIIFMKTYIKIKVITMEKKRKILIKIKKKI